MRNPAGAVRILWTIELACGSFRKTREEFNYRRIFQLPDDVRIRRFASQRVQVSEQIIDLLLRENLAEALHLITSVKNDVGGAGIVRRHSTHSKVLPLKNTFEARPLALAGRVRGVAAVAILVVDVAPGNLLRVEAQLCVALSAFHFAASADHEQQREAEKKMEL